jgi:hypothetical protein
MTISIVVSPRARQMVLGPAAECCLLATEEIVIPRALETRVVTVELAWLNA